MKDSGKIMIVDDFKTNILLIKSILEKKGYEVYYNKDAELAIQMIRQYQFDLILLDVVMPKIDGYQACQLIRKSDLNGKTPIIFITTKNDEQSIIRGFKEGAQDYVTKPFNENELLARVKTQIQLKNHRFKLEELNTHLEKIVSIRTEELNSTLKTLKDRNKELKAARDELKNLDTAKQKFLQIISHEIRTPLNGILGFSSLLNEACNDETYHSYLSCMNESVIRLERFCMEALLITQLNSNMYKTELIKTQVKNLISEPISSLNLSIAEKDLHIQDEINEYEITTDLNLAHSVIFNIIENAVQHSPDKGTISIKARKYTEYYQISISDQGEGFTKDILQKSNIAFINDNFIDNNPGIGLYASHLIMRHLNGNLKIQNKKGTGAQVLVNFSIV